MGGKLERSAKENLIHYGVDAFPEIVESAKGCHVTTLSGRRILDFTSGQMCATIGHNHPAIVSAIQQSAETAIHLFSGMVPESVAELASEIRRIMPEPLTR